MQLQQHGFDDVDDSKSLPKESGEGTVVPKSVEPQQKHQQQKSNHDQQKLEQNLQQVQEHHHPIDDAKQNGILATMTNYSIRRSSSINRINSSSRIVVMIGKI